MKKQLQIRIFPDGHIETRTLHVKGKECLKYFQPLEELLEAKVTDSEFTSEYLETEQEQNDTATLHMST